MVKLTDRITHETCNCYSCMSEFLEISEAYYAYLHRQWLGTLPRFSTIGSALSGYFDGLDEPEEFEL